MFRRSVHGGPSAALAWVAGGMVVLASCGGGNPSSSTSGGDASQTGGGTGPALPPLAVASPPTGPAIPPYQDTTRDKIEAGLATGTLTREQRVLYSVQARIAPDQVPAAYRGAPGDADDDDFLAYLAFSGWDGFSEATKAALRPFVLPPNDPASYLYPWRTPALPARVTTAAAVDSWDSTNVTDRIEVMFPTDRPAVRIAKDMIALEAPSLATKFSHLLMVPIPEIEIWIVPMTKASGLAGPRTYTDALGAHKMCLVRISDAISTADALLSTLAHELFHCFHYEIVDRSQCWDADCNWLLESTATWAMDLAYPTRQGEHRFDTHPTSLSNNTRWDLLSAREQHHYSAYSWHFYVSQRYGIAEVVSEIMAASNGEPRAMLDAEFDFKNEFERFAVWNLNQAPVKYFRDPGPTGLDGFGDYGAARNSIDVHDIPAPAEFSMPVRLERASATYYRLAITNPAVKKLKIDLRQVKAGESRGVGVQALVRRGLDPAVGALEGMQLLENWTGMEEVEFCRDLPDQNVGGVILIVTNSDLNTAFDASAIGIKAEERCLPGWKGTVRVHWSGSQQWSGAQFDNVATKEGGFVIQEELYHDTARDQLRVAGTQVASSDGQTWSRVQTSGLKTCSSTTASRVSEQGHGAGNFLFDISDPYASNIRFQGVAPRQGHVGGTYTLNPSVLLPDLVSGVTRYSTTRTTRVTRPDVDEVVGVPCSNRSGTDIEVFDSDSIGGGADDEVVQVAPGAESIRGGRTYTVNGSLLGGVNGPVTVRVDWDYALIH
jgi:hypothetical protein